MNKMVMIIPIDCQIDEAQYVADEIRSHASKDLPTGAVRHLQLEDHDRDNDGEHAVAESCETIFPHRCDLTSYQIVVVKAELCITAKLAANVRDWERRTKRGSSFVRCPLRAENGHSANARV